MDSSGIRVDEDLHRGTSDDGERDRGVVLRAILARDVRPTLWLLRRSVRVARPTARVAGCGSIARRLRSLVLRYPPRRVRADPHRDRGQDSALSQRLSPDHVEVVEAVAGIRIHDANDRGVPVQRRGVLLDRDPATTLPSAQCEPRFLLRKAAGSDARADVPDRRARFDAIARIVALQRDAHVTVHITAPAKHRLAG